MKDHPYIEQKNVSARCRYCKYTYAKQSELIRRVGRKFVCVFCRPIEQNNMEEQQNGMYNL